MSELWQVCVNEWIKLIRRKRLWVAFALAALLVALFSYGIHQEQATRTANVSPTAVQQQIQSTKSAVSQLKAQKQTAAVQQQEANLNSQLQGLEETYQSDEHPSLWKSTVKKQIANDRQQLNSLTSSPQDQVQAGQVKMDMMLLNYQLQHGVAPLPGWQTSVYSFLQSFLSIVASVFLPLLVVIMTADMVSGETTSGTIKLLLIRPVSRTKILLGKWLTSLVATALLTLATSFAMLLVGMTIVGNQGAGEPQIVGLTYKFVKSSTAALQGGNSTLAVVQTQHAHILSMGRFVASDIFLITLAMFVVATIAFLCSVLFKSAMASTAVAIGVVIVGNIAEGLLHSKWMAFAFTTHLNPADDWTGSLSQHFLMQLGLTQGLLILAAWVVAAMAVSLWKFRRQDILNA